MSVQKIALEDISQVRIEGYKIERTLGLKHVFNSSIPPMSSTNRVVTNLGSRCTYLGPIKDTEPVSILEPI